MKKNNQLGYILAAIYLLTATIILYRWATGISPVIDGRLLGDGHNILEQVLLAFPIFPDSVVYYIAVHLLSVSVNIFDDTLIFVEPLTTTYYLLMVVMNTVFCFFIGKLLQVVISKLSPSTIIKDSKKKARSKV